MKRKLSIHFIRFKRSLIFHLRNTQRVGPFEFIYCNDSEIPSIWKLIGACCRGVEAKAVLWPLAIKNDRGGFKDDDDAVHNSLWNNFFERPKGNTYGQKIDKQVIVDRLINKKDSNG